MPTSTERQLNARALVALLLACAGTVVVVTGLWLSNVRGVHQLRHVHLLTAMLFVSAAVLHITYNLKPLLHYWSTWTGKGLRLEARLALAITGLVVLAGLLWTPNRPR